MSVSCAPWCLPFVLVFGIEGCERFALGESGSVTDTEVDADTDTDADTDADADADTDADSDTDTDTDIPGPMNVLFILTDDQRYDSLAAMPSTRAIFDAEGWDFPNAIVNTPMCCPARASILSGGYYSSVTGVRSNSLPNGGVTRFYDEETLPVRLQAAGYRTGLVGKYLNEYPDIAPYIPPGWDHFEATLTEADWNQFQVVRGSSDASAGSGTQSEVTTYVTDFVTEGSLTFLEEEDDGRPFFLFVSHSAPHYPFTPAPEDAGDWTGDGPHSSAFNEADVSDKPQYVQDHPLGGAADLAQYQDNFEAIMESLASTDRGVAALLASLEASGHADDTLVIFASDNGLQLGEHRLESKGYPYQESIRVPLLMRWPGYGTGTSASLASVTLDVPATIYDVADVPGPSQGVSLRAVLEGDDSVIGAVRYIEAESESGVIPNWQGLVSTDWKYVEYGTGEIELYDLVADPGEASSLHAESAYRAQMLDFREQLEAERGFAIFGTEFLFPAFEFSSVQLHAVGGTEPYTWELIDGELPRGLSFDGVDTVSGTPASPGAATATFRVTSPEISPQTGEPLEDIQNILFLADVKTMLKSPPTARLVRGGARFTVTLDRVANDAVVIEVGPSPDFDDNAKRVVGRRVATDTYAAQIDGLTPGETWFWRVKVGGRVVDAQARRFVVPE